MPRPEIKTEPLHRVATLVLKCEAARVRMWYFLCIVAAGEESNTVYAGRTRVRCTATIQRGS